MLSSVLKSEKAIQINIAIMRALGDLSESLEDRMITRKEFEEVKKQVFIDKDRITANYWSIMYILRNLPKQLKENNK
ncbi:MAG: hypothetical protein LHV68_05010 [Elusimicrobia bacterium]|nr:hypothetical protein [Candidatus Liberimonas magnetica]